MRKLGFAPLVTGAFLFCILCVFPSAESARGDINSALRKYRQISPSAQQIERLQRYQPYIDYFTSFSYFLPRHKVSPNFIKSLILAESSADPSARSHKDAIGLGQILLSTGRQAAKELSQTKVQFDFIDQEKLKDLREEDLHDPAMNILLTCFLIAKYNYKFDGKIELVVSAWNAGENTKSLAQMRHAPYEETENLIGKVNGYYLYFLRQSGT